MLGLEFYMLYGSSIFFFMDDQTVSRNSMETDNRNNVHVT